MWETQGEVVPLSPSPWESEEVCQHWDGRKCVRRKRSDQPQGTCCPSMLVARTWGALTPTQHLSTLGCGSQQVGGGPDGEGSCPRVTQSVAGPGRGLAFCGPVLPPGLARAPGWGYSRCWGEVGQARLVREVGHSCLTGQLDLDPCPTWDPGSRGAFLFCVYPPATPLCPRGTQTQPQAWEHLVRVTPVGAQGGK